MVKTVILLTLLMNHYYILLKLHNKNTDNILYDKRFFGVILKKLGTQLSTLSKQNYGIIYITLKFHPTYE